MKPLIATFMLLGILEVFNCAPLTKISNDGEEEIVESSNNYGFNFGGGVHSGFGVDASFDGKKSSLGVNKELGYNVDADLGTNSYHKTNRGPHYLAGNQDTYDNKRAQFGRKHNYGDKEIVENSNNFHFSSGGDIHGGLGIDGGLDGDKATLGVNKEVGYNFATNLGSNKVRKTQHFPYYNPGRQFNGEENSNYGNEETVDEKKNYRFGSSGDFHDNLSLDLGTDGKKVFGGIDKDVGHNFETSFGTNTVRRNQRFPSYSVGKHGFGFGHGKQEIEENSRDLGLSSRGQLHGHLGGSAGLDGNKVSTGLNGALDHDSDTNFGANTVSRRRIKYLPAVYRSQNPEIQ